MANVVEDFQKKQSSRNSRIEIDPIVGIEMIQETDTETKTKVETEVEIEAEIEEIAETTADTLTKKISVNTVTEQVIQHIGVSNLKTI